MKLRLNQIIDQSLLTDKVINDNVKVENNILYITIDDTEYKYDQGNYYQKVINENEEVEWVNLQGGVPGYELDSITNPDPNIFYSDRVLIYSKLKCLVALKSIGKWDMVKAALQESDLYDLYLAAQNFSEDNENFKNGLAMIQRLTGLTDQDLSNILSNCISDDYYLKYNEQ